MAKRQIDYGRLVEQALRTVVRDVLDRVAREGLLGSHHFFITFRTGDPGVEITDYLRERYPVEMTIVLQYQYWDLQVDDDGFAVTLSFNNMPERLRIPFAALKVFADPGAEFGLQFTIEPEERVVALPTAGAAGVGAEKAVPLGLVTQDAEDASEPAEEADRSPAGEGEGGANIVTLDRFRKK
jgi:uncharacterized protein